MKSTRHDEILKIISAKEIETQEELASELRTLGYRVTQATISRDIRELHLIKVISDRGGYKYAKPDRRESAGQMVVVRTLSGSANVAAEAIDTMNWPGILGTIAGDNTIFIVVRDENDASDIASRLIKLTFRG